MLNLSPLFFTTLDDESCMHDELDLTPEQRAWIASARTDVRDCLRTGIPGVLSASGYTEDVPQPRFFTQGSWAYKTLNSPAQRPQQADVDDGCYLPMSFVSQTKRPSTATTVFFAAAEEALKPLVEEKRWKLVTDKPTCIRIVIAAYAHIDIPLYAIPDEEFVMLAKASMERYGYDSLTEAVNMAERDAWTALPADEVLLAHRECNWMRSDPRPVKEWFLGEVDAKGEQFRRVVRYRLATKPLLYLDGRRVREPFAIWANGTPIRKTILILLVSIDRNGTAYQRSVWTRGLCFLSSLGEKLCMSNWCRVQDEVRCLPLWNRGQSNQCRPGTPPSSSRATPRASCQVAAIRLPDGLRH